MTVPGPNPSEPTGSPPSAEAPGIGAATPASGDPERDARRAAAARERATRAEIADREAESASRAFSMTSNTVRSLIADREIWYVPRGVLPPPAEPGTRHVSMPRRGTVVADDLLRTRVDRVFHWPMIILALFVLPLLAIEMFFLRQLDERGWLGVAVLVASAVIWFAFLIEFVVKIAIAENRFEYVRRHWIDLIIIMAPALRALRVARVIRTVRIFTLRGVGLKGARAALAMLLGLDAAERLAERFGLRKDGRPVPERMTRLQLTREVKRLRRRVDAWEAWFDEHRVHRDTHGVDTAFDQRPLPTARPARSAPGGAAPAASASAGAAASAGSDAPAVSPAAPAAVDASPAAPAAFDASAAESAAGDLGDRADPASAPSAGTPPADPSHPSAVVRPSPAPDAGPGPASGPSALPVDLPRG